MPSAAIVVDIRATVYSEGAKGLQGGPSVAVVTADCDEIRRDVQRKKSLIRARVALQTSYFEREAGGRRGDQREIGTRSADMGGSREKGGPAGSSRALRVVRKRAMWPTPGSGLRTRTREHIARQPLRADPSGGELLLAIARMGVLRALTRRAMRVSAPDRRGRGGKWSSGSIAARSIQTSMTAQPRASTNRQTCALVLARVGDEQPAAALWSSGMPMPLFATNLVLPIPKAITLWPFPRLLS
jgi:hypothetical protein